MHIPGRLLRRLTPTALLCSIACARHPAPVPPPFPDRAPPDTPAPDSFQVAVETTRGPVVLMIHRDWAPHGVDRFYSLVRQRYYDSAAVFRVVPKFVVQFGLAADPRFTELYRRQMIPDDTVRKSNVRGMVTFARSNNPNTRTTQIFINLVDNARLDVANGFGFPPIGQVIKGMEFVDLFNAEYNGDPSQNMITSQGNAYLRASFPRLDYIVRMRIGKEWKRR